MRVQDLIFYEIYPKSFCDTNGDGVGDLTGVLSKIGYLKELGVNAVWITPCFQTPNVDNGYDISDYRDIEESVGTLAQMEELIKTLHENGIKVILDLVANHTSTAHKWFLQSRSSKDNPYRDYYIWRKTPPNDWQSVFGGSAWEYDEQTGEYYLHSFAVEQADLNWENPKVREEMKAVVDYWVQKGVDGFRCDVLDMISKDFEKGENGSGPHLHEYIRELFGRDSTRGLFTVGECWSADTQNAALFCGADRQELTTVFAFTHLCLEKGRFLMEKPPLQELCSRIAQWQIAMQKAGLTPTVFLNNHDQPRSVSRFGEDTDYRYESATLLAALTLLHRGVPFLFQGEEVGLTNSTHENFEEFNDVETVNYYTANKGKIPEKEMLARINYGGRDNPRHLIPWTAETGESWLAPYSRAAEINVAADRRARKSVFSFYQALIALRKAEKCLTDGKYTLLELSEERYVFQREYENERMIIVCNFQRQTPFEGVANAAALLSNYEMKKGVLQPYQIVVYKLVND